jgi:RsiW-degrading membrane proteinase PrsW (M82 family)
MGLLKSRWLQILVIGLLLFIAVEQALRITGNPNFIPVVLMLGSFLLPVVFVAYFFEREEVYDRGIHRESPLVTATLCFLVGGVLGVVIAGLIEFQTLRQLSVPGLFGVGLIEEGVKLIFPVILFVRALYRSEADGLLFGVASGMGFAALETMGYGLVALVSSQGDVTALENVILVRGLLSPAGHAAWTGLICAVLWRERARKDSNLFYLRVLAVFILAVVLHALWDIVNSLSVATVEQLFIVVVGNVAIAVISLTLLMLRLREAKRYVK